MELVFADPYTLQVPAKNKEFVFGPAAAVPPPPSPLPLPPKAGFADPAFAGL